MKPTYIGIEVCLATKSQWIQDLVLLGCGGSEFFLGLTENRIGLDSRLRSGDGLVELLHAVRVNMMVQHVQNGGQIGVALISTSTGIFGNTGDSKSLVSKVFVRPERAIFACHLDEEQREILATLYLNVFDPPQIQSGAINANASRIRG